MNKQEQQQAVNQEARKAVEVSSDDIIDAFGRMLQPIVKHGRLANENRWGVDMLYSKSQKGLLTFHFITNDMLEISIEFDMFELQKQGKIYIDSRMELLTTQMDAAREERQKNNSIEIMAAQNSSKFHEKKPLIQCVRDQLHGPSVIGVK